MPGAKEMTVCAAVDGERLYPLNVPELAEGHGQQVNSVVDESRLQVQSTRQLSEVQTFPDEELLSDNPVTRKIIAENVSAGAACADCGGRKGSDSRHSGRE